MCAHPQERGTGSGRMPREQAEPSSAGRAVLARVTSTPGGTCPWQVSCPDEAAWALPKYSPVYSQHRGGTFRAASARGRHGPQDAWGDTRRRERGARGRVPIISGLGQFPWVVSAWKVWTAPRDGMRPLADPSSALGPAAQGSPQGHSGPSQGPSGVPSSAQGLSIPSDHQIQQGPPAGEGLGPGPAQP